MLDGPNHFVIKRQYWISQTKINNERYVFATVRILAQKCHAELYENEALDTSAIFQQPGDTLVVLGKLIQPRDKIKGSNTRLNLETSLYVLRIARKLSRPILDTEQLSGRKTFHKSLTTLIDLVFRTTKSCENPETAVAAFEVAAEVRSRLGVHKLRDALPHQFTKFEYLTSLPVQLIPAILTKGCKDFDPQRPYQTLVETILAVPFGSARHTSAEFVAFLTDIVIDQPRGTEIHVIARSRGTFSGVSRIHSLPGVQPSLKYRRG
jgi:hypothetical protein